VDHLDHNGLRIFYERGNGDGWAVPVEYYFHAAYSLEDYPPADTVHRFQIRVSPDHLYERGLQASRQESSKKLDEFAREHGLQHVKALIDLEQPHGESEETWSGGDHPEGWTERKLSEEDLRARLVGAFRQVGQAVELDYSSDNHIDVEGIACVLNVPEDTVNRALLDLHTLGFIDRGRIVMTADIVGPLASYGVITAEGLNFLRGWASTTGISTVAALSCDVVDSTARNRSVGDAEWAAVMKPFHEQARGIVRTEGGSVRNTAGDSVLATFPTSARAVRAGSALTEMARQFEIELRVGINLGDFREPVGGEDLLQQDVINIASRIEGVAQPGEVWVSEAVMRTALPSDPSLSFEPMGDHAVDGVEGELPLYRANGGSA
jgi:class 3 adenylate cyclase